jgi:hypothetical protein
MRPELITIIHEIIWNQTGESIMLLKRKWLSHDNFQEKKNQLYYLYANVFNPACHCKGLV